MNGTFALSVLAGAVLAWLTHVFTCFSEGMWGFLLAGAVFFPLGILHGVYLWFR